MFKRIKKTLIYLLLDADEVKDKITIKRLKADNKLYFELWTNGCVDRTKLKIDIDTLEKCIQRNIDTLNTLVHIYASEFCDTDKVKKALDTVADNGGTLAYIADILDYNRKCLELIAPNKTS